MVRIEFYSLLRLLLKQEKLELQAVTDETINQLLQRVQKQLPTPFLHKLLDGQGALIPGTIIMVNRRNILHLDELKTRVSDGDTIAFFPPGAGG